VTDDTLEPQLDATLPSGAPFVPGVTPACAGPDACGSCSSVPAGATPPCDGANWHLRAADGVAWSFVFRAGSDVCPVAVLNPVNPGRLLLPRSGLSQEVGLALSLATSSLIAHPGNLARAAHLIQSDVGWSFQRALWFIQVNRDRLPGT
jgi:hypothetical protein